MKRLIKVFVVAFCISFLLQFGYDHNKQKVNNIIRQQINKCRLKMAMVRYALLPGQLGG